jgi:hypothetical protein
VDPLTAVPDGVLSFASALCRWARTMHGVLVVRLLDPSLEDLPAEKESPQQPLHYISKPTS